jgi:hypothetical protein
MSVRDPLLEWMGILARGDENDLERRLAGSNVIAHVTALRVELRAAMKRIRELEDAPRWVLHHGGKVNG